MRHKIIVITRRYENKGLGLSISEANSLGYTYNEHTIDKYDHLYPFWTIRLDDCAEDISIENELEHIQELFKRLNEKYKECAIPEIETRLTRIYELIKEDRSTHIYIYHQWLDKQGRGSSNDNNSFLEALKNDILQIEGNRSAEECEFNWLIHDSDILSHHYDGLLQFGSKIHHPHKDVVERNIPPGLEQDNIWCFTHEQSSNYYFDFIYNVFDNEKVAAKLESAERFYYQLAIDKKGCERRMKILGMDDDDERKIDKDSLCFLLQKEPIGNFRNNMTVRDFKKELEENGEIK